MLTILTAIIGFLGGFVPDILKMWKDKKDKEHELAVMKLQMEAQEKLHTQRIEEINTEADIKESEALYKSAELKPSGISWIDGFMYFYNSTVRPTVTYGFVGLYALHKLSCIKLALEAGTDKWLIFRDSYNEYDQATLTLVLSYYFGQRQAKWVFNKFYK